MIAILPGETASGVFSAFRSERRLFCHAASGLGMDSGMSIEILLATQKIHRASLPRRVPMATVQTPECEDWELQLTAVPAPGGVTANVD